MYEKDVQKGRSKSGCAKGTFQIAHRKRWYVLKDCSYVQFGTSLLHIRITSCYVQFGTSLLHIRQPCGCDSGQPVCTSRGSQETVP